MLLIVKNMVCPRCIKVIREELEKASIIVYNIRLGEVEIADDHHKDLDTVEAILKENGFELLSDKRKQISEKIKNIIILHVHFNESTNKVVLSNLLEQAIQLEYHYLSSVFSHAEGITIEKYYILQKIERVKEFLEYNEFTISEIAFKTGYSSTAHLSAQFKKITGVAPTEYRKKHFKKRVMLDSI